MGVDVRDDLEGLAKERRRALGPGWVGRETGAEDALNSLGEPVALVRIDNAAQIERRSLEGLDSMVRAVDQIVEFERGATSVDLLELLADAVEGSLDLPPQRFSCRQGSSSRDLTRSRAPFF